MGTACGSLNEVWVTIAEVIMKILAIEIEGIQITLFHTVKSSRTFRNFRTRSYIS